MENWIGEFIGEVGYFGIALLMLLENIFPPIPSEVVIPLAGFEAANNDKLSLFGVIIAGSFGSLLGALFWYYIGRWLGLDRLKNWSNRHGRWITLSGEDIEWINEKFQRYGSWAVLFGRVIPTVRSLVAIPAGIFAMPLIKFIPLTSIGILIWGSVLSVLGYQLGERYIVVQEYLGPITTVIMVVIVLVYSYRVITFSPDDNDAHS